MNYITYLDYIENIILEKEEDHEFHMKMKQVAQNKTEKDLNSLPNKKYKKDSEKADLYYKGRERMIQKDLSENDGNEYARSKPGLRPNPSSIDDRGFDVFLDNIKLKDKDRATTALRKMRDYSDLSNPKDKQKYDLAFNIFCRRFHIPKDSSLWVKFNPGKEINLEDIDPAYKGKKSKIPDRLTLGSYKELPGVELKHGEKRKEIGINIPKGYKLLHNTDKGGIHHLQPNKRSTKFLGHGEADLNGQYHPTGRSYFTLVNDNDENTKSYGKKSYRLNQKVDKVYLDTEHLRHFDDKEDLENLSIDKLLNKPVYIKSEDPIRVKRHRRIIG